VPAPPIPAGFSIRDATDEDAPAIHALYVAAYSPESDPSRSSLAPLRDTVEDVRAYVRDSRVLVLEDTEGRIVATAAVRRVANVRRLAVMPEAKGAGLGAAMLDAALDAARDEGFEVAQLETPEAHPWLAAFYSRHGFEARGVETTADGSAWRVMRKRL
jgi:GNAT superfamily N-acetyltransferase